MNVQLNKSTRLLFALTIIAVIGVMSFVSVKPASAGGSGGIAVRPAKVCRNGIYFTGTDTDAAALNRPMTAEIFHGHVGVPINLAATGTTRTFTVVGQTHSFSIHYPSNTFAIGEDVTYSVLSHDGSGYGGGQFGVVQNCHTWFGWGY